MYAPLINTHSYRVAACVCVCVCCYPAVVVLVQPNGEHETRAWSQALPHTRTHILATHTHTASSALAHFTRGCPASTMPAHTSSFMFTRATLKNEHTHTCMHAV